ncbi:hypothetical protein [Daejeonella sp. JGW-45]|uniref:hypothetical protein n=1 Tax=Daejeonella sp. JGW-45 TaxID=3034148 RepID=UPI0023EAAC1A|nr:hypothetical protein [Daejeonella sp. JGW-45]
MRIVTILYLLLILCSSPKGLSAQMKSTNIIICSTGDNNVSDILKANNYGFRNVSDQLQAVKAAKQGAGILFIANGYPHTRLAFNKGVGELIKAKKLKVFIEYPAVSTNLAVGKDTIQTQLERAVINTSKFRNVDSLDLIGIHNVSVIRSTAKNPLIIVAKVAGFDRAQYGISDVRPDPILFHQGNTLVATTRLSNPLTSRFGPRDHIQPVWEYIFNYLNPSINWKFDKWPLEVKPMHSKSDNISSEDYQTAINKGVDWFYKGRFFIHPSWENQYLKYIGKESPPVDQKLPSGDGSLGVLEGHLSRIQMDGSQTYRYWIRADCNAEVAYALSASRDTSAGQRQIASNLLDYLFKTSNMRSGNKNDPKSPSYGLVGWSTNLTYPDVYYGDDNARVILGALGASARMDKGDWDRYIAECILANFRTTGKNGFRSSKLFDAGIIKSGLPAIQENPLINPHPHYESWIWATYLWLYDKTGYKPLLDKAKKAITMTMEAYPNWKWTNGIQQERARMILPLAWLIRVEDTPRHRQWLDLIAGKLLENLDESGAIREELGASETGSYGATKTNADYGKHEAPLIASNGDPVGDMLYTTNFGFFALNEAAAVTGDAKYKNAVRKIADFLVKIQVKSTGDPALDGAWFRAFDYKRWDYWASNADQGWGAWGTLTGWTQSWIVTTLALQQENQNLWDLSKRSKINGEAQKAIKLMLTE